MKDIVANRSRISITDKVEILFTVLRENGIWWTTNFAVYYVGSTVANAAFSKMHRMREKNGLPGLNSASLNRQIWKKWDWAAAGEEWTQSDPWKASLVGHILNRNTREGDVVVEIGPGAGRWTSHLLAKASSLTGIDISTECVRICSEKFGESGKADFRLTQACELPGVGDATVDLVWSFDVFVHINTREVAGYLDEIYRVLKPGGKAILHHGTVGGENGGWRSDLTLDRFNELLKNTGLQIVEQFEEWDDPQSGEKFQVGLYKDALSIFTKP